MQSEKFDALRAAWNRPPDDVASGANTTPAARRGMQQAAQAGGSDFFAFAGALSQVKNQTGGGGR